VPAVHFYVLGTKKKISASNICSESAYFEYRCFKNNIVLFRQIGSNHVDVSAVGKLVTAT
jgi:hypothetical protein